MVVAKITEMVVDDYYLCILLSETCKGGVILFELMHVLAAGQLFFKIGSGAKFFLKMEYLRLCRL